MLANFRISNCCQFCEHFRLPWFILFGNYMCEKHNKKTHAMAVCDEYKVKENVSNYFAKTNLAITIWKD